MEPSNPKVVLARYMFYAWRNFQALVDSETATVPWWIWVIALQIMVATIVMVAWSVRLYKKGKEIAECSFDETIEDSSKNFPDDGLLEEGTLYFRKKMLFDLVQLSPEELQKARNEFCNSLRSIYNTLKEKHGGNQKLSRRLMMKRFRCEFVKHPYDVTGRKMAIEAKNVFLQNILEEVHWWHNLQKIFQIPTCLRKSPCMKNVMVYLTAIIVLFSAIKTSIIYFVDIGSDVDVLVALHKATNDFKAPKFSELGTYESIKEGILDTLPKQYEEGILGLEQPCGLFDLLQDILDTSIPFHSLLVRDLAGQNLNPNEPSNFAIDDGFETLAAITQILKQVVNIVNSGLFGNQSWDPMMLKRNMDMIKKQLKNTKDKLSGWLVKTFGGISNLDEMKKLIDDGIDLITAVDNKLFKKPLIQAIIRKGSIMYKETKQKWDDRDLGVSVFMDIAEKFFTYLDKEWNKDVIGNFSYKAPVDPLMNTMNTDQIKCRKYLKKALDFIVRNETLKFVDGIILGNVTQGIDEINEGIISWLESQTKYLLYSGWVYLLITLIWTILIELKSTVEDFLHFGLIPMVTNLKMAWDESNPDSKFCGEGRNENIYLVKASKRFSLTITEATKETLYAINIQLAIYIYLKTGIHGVSKVMHEVSELDVPETLFGFSDNSFTKFRKSPLMYSLIMGIFSLTLAQYQKYMTKHKGDVELCGTIVYFLACLVNTLSIFMTQVSFFALGLSFLQSIVVILIRNIIGMKSTDNFPTDNKEVVILLNLLIVLLPLNYIPIYFAKSLRNFTTQILLRENFHQTKRNRSGYEIPGCKLALYMFFPCSSNDFSHIGSPNKLNHHGFNYFSKCVLSRKLYRQKFEIQIFSKFVMHLFYIIASFVMLNTIHIVLKVSNSDPAAHYLSLLEFSRPIRIMGQCLACAFPTLLISYGCLFLFYKKCHPWKSEGVSVGFEPKDNGYWRPFTLGESSEEKWAEGVWHDHDNNMGPNLRKEFGSWRKGRNTNKNTQNEVEEELL